MKTESRFPVYEMRFKSRLPTVPLQKRGHCLIVMIDYIRGLTERLISGYQVVIKSCVKN